MARRAVWELWDGHMVDVGELWVVGELCGDRELHMGGVVAMDEL